MGDVRWALLGGLLVGATLLALLVGPTDHTLAAALHALWTPADDPTLAVVLYDVRLPRAIAAALVGAALGAGGAIMQVVTRNPLAGPGIMGLNGGGALAVLAILLVDPRASLITLALGSLGGAALAAITVLAIARSLRGGMSPLSLTLCGAALAALFGSVAGALVIASGMINDMLYWTTGGLGTVGWDAIGLLVGGLTPMILLIGPHLAALTVLLLGDDAAIGLGQRVRRLRIRGIVAVVIGAGIATAVAGPVGFVGLMAPHAARALFGHDQRRVVPVAGLIGAVAVQIADVIGRVATPPSEVPLGVFLSLVGAPLLVLLLARRRALATLA